MHLVNYDYDERTDQFYKKSNVTVTVRVGSAAVDEVLLQGPDISTTENVRFTRSGDLVTLTVPELEAWAVLSFTHR